LLLCVVVAGLALTGFWVARPNAEPSYNSRPLSDWVEILGKSANDEEETHAAAQAVDIIGPAAIPYLIKWTQYETPKWRRKLFERLALSRFTIVQQFALKISETRSDHLAAGTFDSFKVLGTRATPAYDDLCRMMNSTNPTDSAVRAAENLACLGTNALPALLALAQDSQHPCQYNAMRVLPLLSNIGNNAPFVLHYLLPRLDETNDPHLSAFTTEAIGRLRLVPEVSIPALVRGLHSRRILVRSSSAQALGEFGPAAAPAIPHLTNALADSEPDVRNMAELALYQIDPVTFTNTPAIYCGFPR
jgi:HEAT repeat protein